MKSREWDKMFDEQRQTHGKTLFTIHELSNITGASLRCLNVELSRLRKRGIVQRYGKGTYGPVEGVNAEALLPYLDKRAYITGFHALHRYNLVTQVPRVVHAFTSRRHNRSRERVTPVGRIVFVCVSDSVYSYPEEGVTASPEQALFDYVYLLRRESLHAESLVTFRNLESLDRSELIKLAPR
jgi:hypothetical protein